MRTLIIFITLLVTVSNLRAQSVKADHYLDIPGQTRTSTSGAGAFFPGNTSLAVSSRVSVSTLKLTLVSIERNDIVYGDYFVYEVLIENTGKEAVTLPWSGDRGAFVQPAPRTPVGYISGGVYLQVESSGAQPTVLGLLDQQPLYGSDEVPRTRLVLAPGRTALLKAPAQLSATMPQGRAAILGQADGAVMVRAVFSIHTDKLSLTRSSNVLPVRVQPRQLQ